MKFMSLDAFVAQRRVGVFFRCDPVFSGDPVGNLGWSLDDSLASKSQDPAPNSVDSVSGKRQSDLPVGHLLFALPSSVNSISYLLCRHAREKDAHPGRLAIASVPAEGTQVLNTYFLEKAHGDSRERVDSFDSANSGHLVLAKRWCCLGIPCPKVRLSVMKNQNDGLEIHRLRLKCQGAVKDSDGLANAKRLEDLNQNLWQIRVRREVVDCKRLTHPPSAA